MRRGVVILGVALAASARANGAMGLGLEVFRVDAWWAYVVVTIIFAIIHKIRTDEDTVNQEDELDKLIDLKATRVFYNVFMAGVVLALLGQALGLPLSGFFLMLGGAIVAAGLTLDLTQLFFYRRGI